MIFIQRKTGWKVSFKVKTREISCSSLGWMLFTVAQMAKASAHIVGDLGSIPGSGRSPGEGKGNPLQHSCLENPMDREAWWATVHEVAESQHAWATSLTHSLSWLASAAVRLYPERMLFALCTSSKFNINNCSGPKEPNNSHIVDPFC